MVTLMKKICCVYGITVSSDTKQVLSIIDKILMCLWALCHWTYGTLRWRSFKRLIKALITALMDKYATYIMI